MSPITHFLVSWCSAEALLGKQRERALVVMAGLVPDIDGLGLLIDLIGPLLGFAHTDFFQSLHRHWTHSLCAALLFATLASRLSTRQRIRVFLLALLVTHLHLLCDLAGARGSLPDDLWGIDYWSPWLPGLEYVWSHQWPLIGWQNFAITSTLLLVTLWRARTSGYSPLGLISPSSDKLFVHTLRQRFPLR